MQLLPQSTLDLRTQKFDLETVNEFPQEFAQVAQREAREGRRDYTRTGIKFPQNYLVSPRAAPLSPPPPKKRKQEVRRLIVNDIARFRGGLDGN